MFSNFLIAQAQKRKHMTSCMQLTERDDSCVRLAKKMRLRWKLVFLAICVAAGGLIWQNADARAQFIHEMDVLRNFCNRLADGYEPWQVNYLF